MAMDISAVGASIRFSGGLDLTITEFSDEGTPFDCPDVDVSTNAKNLNGEMISSRTPSVYPFSITVIPGSVADIKLRQHFAKNAIQPGNNNASTVTYIESCTITMPAAVRIGGGDDAGSSPTSKNSVTFTNIRAKSGPTGPSTSADGRMSARTYSFEAEGYSAA